MQTRETHPVSASMENDHHKTLGLDLVFLERPHMSTSPILHFWEKVGDGSLALSDRDFRVFVNITGYSTKCKFLYI
jgi:hypothetical protein